ncbi:MAG: DUF2760 domain-containing protein [Thermoguttaceae bacterium]|nr:DUF2760 domain-containing protein [Thermoguttaceae bacterium]
MGLIIAIKAFATALSNSAAARRIEAALYPEVVASISSEPNDARPETAPDAEGVQPSAVALLAALQREARFVDFVKEPLDALDDATVGAASRNVQKRCAETLERFFAIRPLSAETEGAPIELDADAAKNSTRVRVMNVRTARDAEKIAGRLAHSGWRATKNAVPKWSGTADDAFVLAPMEIDCE